MTPARGARAFVAAMCVGALACVGLLALDSVASRAGAQEETTTTEVVEPTTTTESTTTTSEPAATTTTTTTTTVPPAPVPVDVDSSNVIGSRESAQWLALLAAFTLGHLVTR